MVLRIMRSQRFTAVHHRGSGYRTKWPAYESPRLHKIRIAYRVNAMVSGERDTTL